MLCKLCVAPYSTELPYRVDAAGLIDFSACAVRRTARKHMLAGKCRRGYAKLINHQAYSGSNPVRLGFYFWKCLSSKGWSRIFAADLKARDQSTAKVFLIVASKQAGDFFNLPWLIHDLYKTEWVCQLRSWRLPHLPEMIGRIVPDDNYQRAKYCKRWSEGQKKVDECSHVASPCGSENRNRPLLI